MTTMIGFFRAYGWFRVQTVLAVLFLPLCASAQSGVFTSHEADIWYFGNKAGLRFTETGPEALTDGAMDQHEGSAVASDPISGDLLFYTDGQQVWNAQHDIMKNGNGILGHWTSSQTALIVRAPGNSRLYYLFTVGSGTYANPNNNGFRYSLIDMSEEGGLGSVIEKNVSVRDSTSEKLTATRHCNGRDYWILVHDFGDPGDAFLAYLLTPEGLQDPVVSHSGIRYSTGHDLQGAFKFSPDGERLAVTSAGPQRLEFFQFDRLEGTVYDQMVIDSGDNFYGVEFSVSGQRLYTTLLPPDRIPATLSQYDLNQPSTEEIRSSRTILHTENGSWEGAQLLMGPDGRIYASFFRRSSLGVINDPEALGMDADYDHAGLDLETGMTEYGLPNFIQANLFFETAGPDLDSLINYPCTLPDTDTVDTDTVKVVPECPEKDSIHLMIGNHVGSAEGDRVTVPVRATHSTVMRSISEFTMSVTFDPSMFLLEEPTTSSSTTGTLLDGWDLQSYTQSYGEAVLHFRTDPPRSLPDTGIFCVLRFRSYLGFSDELYTLFGLTLDFGTDTCVVPVTRPGRADLDLCGESFRLMDLASGKYQVTSINWSPEAASLRIGLSTALPAPMRIEIFDLAGNRVADVFHPSLAPGNHNAQVDGSSLPTGSYLVRIASGPWETVRTVTVRR